MILTRRSQVAVMICFEEAWGASTRSATLEQQHQQHQQEQIFEDHDI